MSGHIDTPALVVDLDVLTSNITRTAALAASRGVELRPHAKTHKSPDIAHLQMRHGAVGLTVATLQEAETFAAAGFTDILVAYPIVPVGAKLDRLRGLLSSTCLTVGVENRVGAMAVARAASKRPVHVLIEIDSGQHRTGVTAKDAGELAAFCVEQGLRVEGVFTHGGHAYADPHRPASAARDESAALVAAVESLRREGIEAKIVSSGTTPTLGFEKANEITEERPGTYVFNDRQQVTLGAAGPLDCALKVAATVVSVRDGRAVIDAGSKALTAERPDWLAGFGTVDDWHAATVVSVSEHHGIVHLKEDSPAVGDVVRVTPNHACTVVNLFDEYLVMKDRDLVAHWSIAARGQNR